MLMSVFIFHRLEKRKSEISSLAISCVYTRRLTPSRIGKQINGFLIVRLISKAHRVASFRSFAFCYVTEFMLALITIVSPGLPNKQLRDMLFCRILFCQSGTQHLLVKNHLNQFKSLIISKKITFFRYV